MKRMPAMMSVMTPFPYSIDIDAPLTEARKMMAVHDIRHLPVSVAGRFGGLVSDRDISLVTEPSGGKRALEGMRVRDVCVLPGYTVELSERLDRVLLHMAEYHIGSALILKQGKLVGIFTATDACRCFGEYLRALFPDDTGNDAA
jgi:CBS domain-containing protein